MLMILLRWHLSVMTRLALANKEKGVLSVNIVASLVIRLTSVMHYMSVNIVASQVTRLIGVIALYGRPPRSAIVIQTNLSPSSSLRILLLLFHLIHLLRSTKFSNGIRINNLLVPLHLSLTQVHLLLV